MIQSAKDEVNIAKDQGLWLDFSLMTLLIRLLVDPVTVNTTMDHLTSLTGISVVSGKPVRYCSQKLFVRTKSCGENYKREWCIKRIVYSFVCKLAPKNFSHFVTRQGFSEWRNTIVY